MCQGHDHGHLDGEGACVWIIPDGYIPEIPEGMGPGPTGYISHETLCVVNTSPHAAHCLMTVYFEDGDPLKDLAFTVMGERSLHLRMDQIKERFGCEIRRGRTYSLRIAADRPVVCQLSRLDATQPNLTLFTAIGHAVD